MLCRAQHTPEFLVFSHWTSDNANATRTEAATTATTVTVTVTATTTTTVTATAAEAEAATAISTATPWQQSGGVAVFTFFFSLYFYFFNQKKKIVADIYYLYLIKDLINLLKMFEILGTKHASKYSLLFGVAAVSVFLLLLLPLLSERRGSRCSLRGPVLRRRAWRFEHRTSRAVGNCPMQPLGCLATVVV